MIPKHSLTWGLVLMSRSPNTPYCACSRVWFLLQHVDERILMKLVLLDNSGIHLYIVLHEMIVSCSIDNYITIQQIIVPGNIHGYSRKSCSKSWPCQQPANLSPTCHQFSGTESSCLSLPGRACEKSSPYMTADCLHVFRL